MPNLTIKLSQFFPLREFLANQKWWEADQETTNLMLQLGDKDKRRYLSLKDCQNFPRKELRIIDQLWVKYSQGKFGFSVQKRIYLQDCNGKLDTNNTNNKEIYEAYHKMADLIGWSKNDHWLSYSDLTFNLTAKKGHLPSRGYEFRFLLSVGLESCKISLFSRL